MLATVFRDLTSEAGDRASMSAIRLVIALLYRLSFPGRCSGLQRPGAMLTNLHAAV